MSEVRKLFLELMIAPYYPPRLIYYTPTVIMLIILYLVSSNFLFWVFVAAIIGTTATFFLARYCARPGGGMTLMGIGEAYFLKPAAALGIVVIINLLLKFFYAITHLFV